MPNENTDKPSKEERQAKRAVKDAKLAAMTPEQRAKKEAKRVEKKATKGSGG